MEFKSIAKGLAEVVVLSLLVALSSMAQQAMGAAGASPKIGQLTQVPTKGGGAQPASNSAKGTQTQLAAKGTQLSALAPRPGEPIARLLKIDGSVLVSTESGLVAGDPMALLKEGTRVIATANTKLIVAFLDGCEVPLDSNQRLEISMAKPCSERILDVKSILIESGVAGGMAALGTSGGLTSAALGGGLQATGALGGLAGTVAVVRERTSDTVSPN